MTQFQEDTPQDWGQKSFRMLFAVACLFIVLAHEGGELASSCPSRAHFFSRC